MTAKAAAVMCSGHSAVAVGLRRTKEGCRNIPWLRPCHASLQTMGSRAPAPTSAHTGARPQRHRSTSPRSMDSDAPSPTSTPPDARGKLRECARPIIPQAAVRPRPLQHVQVPAQSGVLTSVLSPPAMVLPRPLQHRQVPFRSGAITRPPIPRAAVRPRPLQHRQMPTLSSASTCHHIP